jgi:hypothetical protein
VCALFFGVCCGFVFCVGLWFGVCLVVVVVVGAFIQHSFFGVDLTVTEFYQLLFFV